MYRLWITPLISDPYVLPIIVRVYVSHLGYLPTSTPTVRLALLLYLHY